MDMQSFLNHKGITKYNLSKCSGIPKTTIMDICSGKSKLEHCSAKTVQQLAKALDCSMEFIMQMQPPNAERHEDASRPDSKEYLECGLPPYLQASIEKMKTAWRSIDAGEEYLHLDCDYCELQSNINVAEVSQAISSEQAWYLREKYLRIERTGEVP